MALTVLWLVIGESLMIANRFEEVEVKDKNKIMGGSCSGIRDFLG